MPQWVVDRKAWEEAGGRVIGTHGDDGAVTRGEIGFGDGVVRVLGGGALPFAAGMLLVVGALAVRRRGRLRSAAWPRSAPRD